MSDALFQRLAENALRLRMDALVADRDRLRLKIADLKEHMREAEVAIANIDKELLEMFVASACRNS